jgi:hypothetical protein
MFLKNPKYKKLVDFKLKRFVQEFESEQEALLNKMNNFKVEEETESETFRQILKEDWIAEQQKESLKNLGDFLNFLLKSLKTVKSKIFYEKIANYLNTLFKYINMFNSILKKNYNFSKIQKCLILKRQFSQKTFISHLFLISTLSMI